MLYQTYELKSKDIPLIRFSLYGEEIISHGIQSTEYSIKIDHVFRENKALMPKGLSDTSEKSVLHWINRRKVPKNRHFVSSILRSIADDENPLKYADVTYALSVNDAYWIVPEDQNKMLSWNACNLYDHPFNERLANVAFTGYSQKIPGIVTTPEVTSNGAMKKCWTRREQDIYLIKGDSFPRTDGRNEAVMEYYASQVADVMDIKHVPYDLEWFHHSTGEKEVICVCKAFTSNAVGYVDAARYFACKNIDVLHMDLSTPLNQFKLADSFGYEDYADMMVFDSLICNQDRHLGNFGYLINNDTGEFMRPAPIFDNGRSLLYGAANQDLVNLEKYMQESGLYGVMMNFDLAAKFFIGKRHLPGLRKLCAFTFTRHPKCQIVQADTMSILDGFIRKRAQRLLELYRIKEREKKEFLGKKSVISPRKIKYNELSR